MKVMRLIFACGLFSSVSLIAMQDPAHSHAGPITRSAAKAIAESSFGEYVMSRQGWKDFTRQFYRANPNDPDVQILQRYIATMKDSMEKELKPGQTLLEVAKKETFYYGYADEHFILTGQRFNGCCALIAYSEEKWKRDNLPAIEERIAAKSK